jgi:hypothetical protein
MWRWGIFARNTIILSCTIKNIRRWRSFLFFDHPASYYEVPISLFIVLCELREGFLSRFAGSQHSMQMDPLAVRSLFGQNDDPLVAATIIAPLSVGGCEERRHSRSLMKRALETLHDDVSAASTTNSSLCRGSLGVTSSSDDDDSEASPLRAARTEGSTGPRRRNDGRRASTGLSGLVDRSLTSRRQSVLFDDMMMSPSGHAAYCAAETTPAGDRRRSSVEGSGAPAGRCSTDARLNRRTNSLMKISRNLSEVPDNCASPTGFQRKLFQPLEDDENERLMAIAMQPPVPSTTVAAHASPHASLDWSGILRRCHETKVLIAMDQSVPRDMLDTASSVATIQQFGCGITSSFSFYLSSGSTSCDNSQSVAASSQCSADEADAALQGTLDTLLCVS